VAIVGRPNVGKSALFNRIVRSRAAIVEDRPGVTRDRLYREVEWDGRRFVLVDTGGLTEGEDDPVFAQIRPQVLRAVAEASAVLFVVDARAGLTAGDEEVAEVLRRSHRPVLLVANKADHAGVDAGEFYRLGLGEPLPVSALHGLGVGDLLDRVVELLPDEGASIEAAPTEAIRVAIVGRPNAGKSTLMNRLLGEERSIVTPEPGTTLDPVDALFHHGGRVFRLIDTAGLRRRARVREELERRGAMRAQATLKRADVAVLVVDATEGLADQDKHIAGYAHEHGHPIVIAFNKWDAVDRGEGRAEAIRAAVREALPALDYAPVVFLSAKTGERVGRLLEAMTAAYDASVRRIPTAELNRAVGEITLMTPPPGFQGRRLRIYYVTQVAVQPPEFVFFVNDPDLVHFSYERHLENELRRTFDIGPTPIRLRFKPRRRTPTDG
jgi:GTP-binding protein